MKTRLPIDNEKAARIKAMLYEGASQERISGLLGGDQSTISRIKSGQTHGDVPWPNGATGAMPVESDRRGRKDGDKWSHDARIYLDMPGEVQNRILDVVNKQRRETGLDPIPAADDVYESYLNDPDVTDESVALYEARDSEDARIRQVMAEFREISEVERANQRAAEAVLLLQTTSHFGTEDEHTPPVGGELVYSKMPWVEVALRAHDVPIVQEAEKGDTFLQEACSIVFHTLQNSSKDTWKEPNVSREVRKIAERLRIAGGPTAAGEADEPVG